MSLLIKLSLLQPQNVVWFYYLGQKQRVPPKYLLKKIKQKVKYPEWQKKIIAYAKLHLEIRFVGNLLVLKKDVPINFLLRRNNLPFLGIKQILPEAFFHQLKPLRFDLLSHHK